MDKHEMTDIAECLILDEMEWESPVAVGIEDYNRKGDEIRITLLPKEDYERMVRSLEENETMETMMQEVLDSLTIEGETPFRMILTKDDSSKDYLIVIQEA